MILKVIKISLSLRCVFFEDHVLFSQQDHASIGTEFYALNITF
jgi:hypothetical protein